MTTNLLIEPERLPDGRMPSHPSSSSHYEERTGEDGKSRVVLCQDSYLATPRGGRPPKRSEFDMGPVDNRPERERDIEIGGGLLYIEEVKSNRKEAPTHLNGVALTEREQEFIKYGVTTEDEVIADRLALKNQNRLDFIRRHAMNVLWFLLYEQDLTIDEGTDIRPLGNLSEGGEPLPKSEFSECIEEFAGSFTHEDLPSTSDFLISVEEELGKFLADILPDDVVAGKDVGAITKRLFRQDVLLSYAKRDEVENMKGILFVEEFSKDVIETALLFAAFSDSYEVVQYIVEEEMVPHAVPAALRACVEGLGNERTLCFLLCQTEIEIETLREFQSGLKEIRLVDPGISRYVAKAIEIREAGEWPTEEELIEDKPRVRVLRGRGRSVAQMPGVTASPLLRDDESNPGHGGGRAR